MRSNPTGRNRFAYPFVAPFMATTLALVIAQQASAQGVLEEVIVTAEKREASLQDTPLAVSAFSNDDLRRSLIDRPLDLQLSVPNMLMSKGNFTTASIAIRGIGNLAVGSAGDAGTGIHFNGAYLNSPRIFEAEFFDLDRVEVLRGPQGTLYGRNTTAGVLNMITAKPETDALSGNLSLEYGNYNHMRAKGHINIPLTENLAQRFSGFWFERDGFVDNKFDNSEVDDRSMFGFRSSTRWQDDDTDINLVVNYLEEDDSRMRGSDGRCTKDTNVTAFGQYGPLGCLPGSLGNDSTNGGGTITGALLAGIGGALGIPFPADDYANSINYDDPRTQYLDVKPVYQVEDLITTLTIDQEIGNFTVSALASYHDTSFRGTNDYDFTQASETWAITQIPAFGPGAPNPYFCTPSGVDGFCSSGGILVDRGPDGQYLVNRAYTADRSTTEGKEWSTELRIASDFDGPFNFMAGAFYLEYEGETHYYVYSSGLNMYGSVVGVPLSQQLYDNDTSDFELNTWAIFGEAYYEASDNLRMTLGVRYSDEEKKAKQRTIYLAFLTDPNSANGGYEDFSYSQSEPTGRFNIQYDLSDDVMAYAQVSRSFKSGGFNPISADSALVQLDPSAATFDPEFINAFEIGIKSRLMDGALQANVTYFNYDYEGLQISKIVQQTSINENFDASIQGFEGEFAFAASENILFTANLAWLDTEISGGESIDPADPNGSTSIGDGRNPTAGVVSLGNSNVYVGADCPNRVPIAELGGLPGCAGMPVNLSGNSIPGSPEFSANLGARFTMPMNDGANLALSVNYYWQDEYQSRVFNGPIDTIESWEIWNASLRYTPAGETWYAELWGRNLTDGDNVTGQYRLDPSSGLSTNQFLLEPQTYGVTVNYVF